MSVAPEELNLMRFLDEEYMQHPFYGVRRMRVAATNAGWNVGLRRVRGFLRKMGLEAIGPKPRTSDPQPGHKIYPYLLRGLQILAPNHVWSTDITYIPLGRGFAYLVAVMDWFSRCVLAWRLSVTLDVAFCLEALDEALTKAQPAIFNSDQGCQFTSEIFTERLLSANIQVSMDGRGRALDNVFIERLWRSLKYEDVYPRAYDTVCEARLGIGAYLDFYNNRRYHQALEYRTPREVYAQAPPPPPQAGEPQPATQERRSCLTTRA
jgi:putative transposase